MKNDNMNTWYHIQNVQGAGAIAEVFIDDEIGEFGIPARRFLNDLKSVAGQPVNMHINSPGGSLIDAFAIYDFVKLQGYQLTAYISGIAASAATIVSAAASKVYMGEHSYYFIHNPFFSAGHQGQSGDLDKMKADILSIYQKRTGLSGSKLAAMMDAETLLNAREALELGFVDGIVPEQNATAQLKHHWDKLPLPVRQQLDKEAGPLDKVWTALKDAEHWLVERLGHPETLKTNNISIHHFKNNQNMEQNQELENKLDQLLGRLSSLLEQMGDGVEETKEKDLQIQNLNHELQRIKAKKLDTTASAQDADPEREEAADSLGWNYVSRYLQNRFR